MALDKKEKKFVEDESVTPMVDNENVDNSDDIMVDELAAFLEFIMHTLLIIVTVYQ